MLISDLLAYSLRMAGVLGVGQVALAQDTTDAYTALAIMLNQWQAKRWLVFRLEELHCPVISGQPTYTVGPFGNLDTTLGGASAGARRPTDIEAAYVRQLIGASGPSGLPVDFPLSRIDSREEWSRIKLKNLRSWPGRYFYDPTMPTGTFFLWPIPIQNFFELHVAIKPDISNWLSLTVDTDTILPSESEEALIYNLAGRLIVNYKLPMDAGIAALARASLETLRATNLRLQKLGMPGAVLGGRRGSNYVRNPAAGFIETNASVPFSVTSP